MWNSLKIKLFKFKYRDKVIFEHGSMIDRYSEFEGWNRIASDVAINRCNLGLGSYIGEGSIIKDTIIGRFTCVGPNVKTVSGSHPTSGFVSLHPAFYSTRKQSGFTFVSENRYPEYKYADPRHKKIVVIGNDCWIGYGAIIMEGVTIGNGAIVAAGAIVTHDLEPYGIYAGVPAKLIKKRFNEHQIEKLQSIKWWEKDFNWLKTKADAFSNIDLFLKISDANKK